MIEKFHFYYCYNISNNNYICSFIFYKKYIVGLENDYSVSTVYFFLPVELINIIIITNIITAIIITKMESLIIIIIILSNKYTFSSLCMIKSCRIGSRTETALFRHIIACNPFVIFCPFCLLSIFKNISKQCIA